MRSKSLENAPRRAAAHGQNDSAAPPDSSTPAVRLPYPQLPVFSSCYPARYDVELRRSGRAACAVHVHTMCSSAMLRTGSGPRGLWRVCMDSAEYANRNRQQWFSMFLNRESESISGRQPSRFSRTRRAFPACTRLYPPCRSLAPAVVLFSPSPLALSAPCRARDCPLAMKHAAGWLGDEHAKLSTQKNQAVVYVSGRTQHTLPLSPSLSRRGQ